MTLAAFLRHPFRAADADIHYLADTEAGCSVPPTDAGERWPDTGDPWTDDERDALAAAGCPTTRRFARSEHGVDAAWPHSAEYAQVIEPLLDAADRSHRLADAVIAALFVAFVVVFAWSVITT